MATYIVLANFTKHGIRSVKDTSRRADAFKAGDLRLELAGASTLRIGDLQANRLRLDGGRERLSHLVEGRSHR